MESINDRISTSLFLTPYSKSPVGDTDKVAILSRAGPGSTPQEPLALVAKMSDSERSALESEGRDRIASAEEPNTMTPEIRYRTSIPTLSYFSLRNILTVGNLKVYYLLYANDDEMASKVAIDPEIPSLGRIRADSVSPPLSPASIKRCISRVEKTPALAHANLFADISCDTPLKEGYISISRTDGPGLSPNEPMAIVQMPIVQVETPPIPDGKYFIKNRAANIYWVSCGPITNVLFWSTPVHHDIRGGDPDTEVNKHSPTIQVSKDNSLSKCQWDITHDANGDIFMRPLSESMWVGNELIEYTVPVPWRLIPADSKFY